MMQDIREGKRTLMVLHSFEKADRQTAERFVFLKTLFCLFYLFGNNVVNYRLRTILDSHTEKMEEIQEAIDILKGTESIAFAKQFAKDLVSQSWNDIEKNLKEGKAKELLKSFAEYLITRDI
jgi:geranylgeranyl pyrophosphate synthase